MVNRALVYTIYPNEKQNIQCQKTFGCCRFVYNQMLDVQKERHENGEKHLSKTKANTYCNQHLKKKYPFLKEVDKFALPMPSTIWKMDMTAFLNTSVDFPSINVSIKRKDLIQQISQTGT